MSLDKEPIQCASDSILAHRLRPATLPVHVGGQCFQRLGWLPFALLNDLGDHRLNLLLQAGTPTGPCSRWRHLPSAASPQESPRQTLDLDLAKDKCDVGQIWAAE